MIIKETKLCFDDILLVPQYSNLESRTQPDISVKIGSKYFNLTLKAPIISSPMDSITGPKMLVAMDSVGGLGILSRYISMSIEDEILRQTKEISYAIDCGAKNIGCAIGIKNPIEKTQKLTDVGCKLICVDVAHCDHDMVHRTINDIKEYRYKHGINFVLMAGNVCTQSATETLIKMGVDAIKVGIGPGAVCTTRNITGFGVPQLSAIMDCKEKINNISLIADGGLRSTGDLVKALWAGADACMIGYMLSGTDCTPNIGGKKMYRGMSSRNVSCRDDIAPEGINIEVGFKGETIKVLKDFVKGIKSGLAMGGCKNLDELRSNIDAVRVSPLSIKESKTIQ